MVIIREKKTLFIHIPRTGGTIVEHLFDIKIDWQRPNLKSLIGCIDTPEYRLTLQHLTCQNIITYNILDEHEYASLFKFSIVRNPIYRTASLYYYWGGQAKWRSYKNFLIYLKLRKLDDYDCSRSHRGNIHHILPQYKYVYDQSGKLQVDHVCYFENYLNDLQVVFRHIGLDLDMSKIDEQRTVAKTASYDNLYSADELDLVKEIYAKDFELFNY